MQEEMQTQYQMNCVDGLHKRAKKIIQNYSNSNPTLMCVTLWSHWVIIDSMKEDLQGFTVDRKTHRQTQKKPARKLPKCKLTNSTNSSGTNETNQSFNFSPNRFSFSFFTIIIVKRYQWIYSCHVCFGQLKYVFYLPLRPGNDVTPESLNSLTS